jgi:hypothetical protein
LIFGKIPRWIRIDIWSTIKSLKNNKTPQTILKNMDEFKRREFIKLSAISFAGIAMQFSAVSAFALTANGQNGFLGSNPEMNWDAFISKIQALAKTQHVKPWNQSKYLGKVEAIMNKCKFPEFEKVKKAFQEYKNQSPDWFKHELLHQEIDFQISLLQFEKGEYISHHDHPEMCGIINMVTGNALVKNYSIDKLLDKTRTEKYGEKEIKIKSCIIKEVQNEILLPNQTSILTSTESNIHSLMPNKFTQLVDIFTPSYSEESEKGTKWFQVNEKENFEGIPKQFLAEYASID